MIETHLERFDPDLAKFGGSMKVTFMHINKGTNGTGKVVLLYYVLLLVSFLVWLVMALVHLVRSI